ncbi:MAG: DUF7305 domain-containing protein, partial [Acidimicrobiales bacterium]
IYTNGNGNVGDSNGQGFCFSGVLYAPNAQLTANGCKSQYYGSIVINTFTCNGGPNLGFWYDSQFGQLYGNWVTSGYQQINPSSVTFP